MTIGKRKRDVLYRTQLFLLLSILSTPVWAQTEAPHPFSPSNSYIWPPQHSAACTIIKSGTTFTPKCAVNYITIDAANETIALANFLTPNTAVTSYKLVITYSGSFVPGFAAGYQWQTGSAPAQCGGGVTTGCLSAASGASDWVLCDSIDAANVGCGPPITAVSLPSVFAVIGNNSCQATGGGECTTSATNMTGANLLLACIGYYNGGTTTVTPHDSQGNAYTQIYATNLGTGGGTNTGAMFFSQTTNVTGSMTFGTTSTGGSSFSGLTIMGFSGAVASPLDQSTNPANAAQSPATIQPGSITPSQANELLVSCLTGTDFNSVSISSPFTVGSTIATTTGSGYASALASQIQTAPTAQNPTWSITGASGGYHGITGQASFR